MLQDIGRMTKTIVFCSDIEEAAEMRTLLINMNSDLCKKSPYYVTRIVGEDKEGKKQLDNLSVLTNLIRHCYHFRTTIYGSGLQDLWLNRYLIKKSAL